jgi:hypothetical protein
MKIDTGQYSRLRNLEVAWLVSVFKSERYACPSTMLSPPIKFPQPGGGKCYENQKKHAALPDGKVGEAIAQLS